MLSIIVVFILEYNLYIGLIAIGGLAVSIIIIININLMIYILFAIWPFWGLFLPEQSTGFFWILLSLFFLINLITILSSDKKFNLPPREIIDFFIAFLILLILSDIDNLDRIKIKSNILILAYTILIFVYYNWSFHKSPKIIIITILIPLFVTIILTFVTIINNLSIASIFQLVIFRYSAFFSNPNILGNYLNSMIPLLFAFVVIKYLKEYSKIILIILIISFFSLIMSNSRSAYLGIAFSLFFMSMSIKGLRKPVLFCLFSLIIAYSVSPLLQQIVGFVLRLHTNVSSGRFELWTTTLNILKDNYLFGIGIGNQNVNIVGNLPTVGLKHVFIDIGGAHNLYLSKSLELGVMAVPILIYLLYGFFKYIKLNFKKELTLEQMTLNFAGMGVLISVFIRSFFEGSVLIQQGGIFPIFYSWVILFWPLQIYQKNKNNTN